MANYPKNAFSRVRHAIVIHPRKEADEVQKKNRDPALPALIPARWSTERLLVRDADLAECDRLQRLYETGSYLEPWFGEPFAPGVIRRALTEGDLPPGGAMERFKLQVICLRSNPDPIGLLNLYHGYPAENTLWIAYLFLHPDIQQQGYGRETVAALLREAARAGYSKAGIGVQLKNWPGLRFWVSLGFDRITGIYGDRRHSDTTFSVIGLERQLLEGINEKERGLVNGG